MFQKKSTNYEKRTKNDWNLIHTDNGEWVSEDNAIILIKEEYMLMKNKTINKGVHYFFNHYLDGKYWCFRKLNEK